MSPRAELKELIKMFSMLFGDTPMRTTLIEHDLDVGSNPPIKQYFYRCAADKRRALEAEDNQIAVPPLKCPNRRPNMWALFLLSGCATYQR